jgi:predicted nucleotidyltransferase
MTYRLWQKRRALKYNNKVLDIVQFGSSMKENSDPKDIDIAVIFTNTPIKDQLIESQKIKKQIEKEVDKEVHIKSYDLYSLLDQANFARESILIYGKSIITGEYFAKIFGLNPKIQIIYRLEKLDKKTKIRFHYMLRGRQKQYGLLKKYGGKLISPGLIEIMPEHENIFIEAIETITKNYEKKNIMYT